MLEHEFYTLGNEPILFVCKDKADRRYLCSCCHIGDQWVVGQTNEAALAALIENQLSIREVFEAHCDSLFLVIWDGERFEMDFRFPDSLLPKARTFLDLEDEKSWRWKEREATQPFCP